MTAKKKPEIIEEVGFNFSWQEQKVWKIEAPKELMSINKLTWHLDIPFIWSKPNGFYDVLPRDVITRPEEFKDEYERTVQADTSYPIDVMWWRGRWLILDGLHRLMRLYMKGERKVYVRKIPQEKIPEILR